MEAWVLANTQNGAVVVVLGTQKYWFVFLTAAVESGNNFVMDKKEGVKV